MIGLQDERRVNIRPAKQLWLPFKTKGELFAELKKLGVSRDLAWNTAKSAHGAWRLSQSPGLAFALPAKYFANLGLPRPFVKPT